MIRVVTILLICVFPILCLAQTVSIEVTQVANQIAKDGSLGFDQNAQFQRFETMRDISTDEELVVLTNHESPAVRGYAFWALAKNHYPDLHAVFLDHVDDKADVFQRNGCMVGKESVISFMRQVVTPYMYDLDCKKLDDQTRALVK